MSDHDTHSTIIVMHDHNPIAADLPKMQAGGVTAKVYQVEADVEIGAKFQSSAELFEGWADRGMKGMDAALRDIEANSEVCCLALTAADIERAKGQGKVAILLGAEGGKLLEGELSLLEEFHRRGLRELQLTWAFPNQLAREGELTAFGRQVVRECARLGIIVDLTHLPERAFHQVLELTEKPVIVSHGAARGCTTDLDDERLRALAECGGVLGIHFYSSYLGESPTPEKVASQVDYIANLVGIDHVGLGVDFFPTDGPWREFQLAQGTKNIEWAIADMSQMPRITEALMQRGYRDVEIGKVLGLNFLRVCREVFGE
ncbi:MAG: hypothetical protein COS85_22460 [Armatimonadetes bacterium CG07_land_8_20_14_0_80_59_28]|nr:MAG: hypothetical protein COS85_22460 [Armatimonadetes bacterium CG07_land_8_20_14_0_80_59_28]PIX43665.1 MAG: hypothetical protein COZ56_06635 [Armatimonadetes bacterium CG_4_8_14_3_um_filter_58_9]PIY37591.1 MAG: hypothetical protein COZ05_22225 [Armatimonadetes bacterium CG_4_10_14_3_um_filter_59_10]PJB72305.1 MAG: hypothetical protein CO095_07030 [Armatimonadetes bacterium CG_4_9_14_3_um_filter_58_7]